MCRAADDTGAGLVADVDPGDVALDPGDLGAGDAGDGLDAVQVSVERGRGAVRGRVTSASIGAVELTGNSLSSVSDTCRTVEAAGSVLASVPPQEMRRNGAARASSPITITVA